MAASIQIVLRDSGGGSYIFSVDGELAISQELEYKEAANPPELQKIVETWSISNARITAATPELTFDAWQVFLALLEERTGTTFTSAEVRRDTAVERVLGPSGFQEFKIEAVDTDNDPLSPASTYNTVVPVTLRVSAVKVFADGNGIVSWNQTVSNTYKNALHTLEWQTEITTAEGTNAVTAAQTYAVIPIASYGNTYTYDTNGPDGIDYDYTDADEANSRVPTKVTAVSKISQWGVTIGTPSAGNSINGDIEYSTETRLDGTNVFTITRARAEGPGALAWVESKKPTLGNIKASSVFNDIARRTARGEWTVLVSTAQVEAGGQAVTTGVSAVISRGGVDVEFVAISGDLPPKRVQGARQAYRLVVSVTTRFTGEFATLSQMKLPAAPGEPWVFIPNESSEDAHARLVVRGAEAASNEWERSATLVFMSPDVPAQEGINQIFDKLAAVPSYLYPVEGGSGDVGPGFSLSVFS